MRDYLVPLIELLKGKNMGFISGATFFVIALIWVIFGFWNLVFIILMTSLGYAIGVIFLRDLEVLRKWLDKIFPPGLYR